MKIFKKSKKLFFTHFIFLGKQTESCFMNKDKQINSYVHENMFLFTRKCMQSIKNEF